MRTMHTRTCITVCMARAHLQKLNARVNDDFFSFAWLASALDMGV